MHKCEAVPLVYGPNYQDLEIKKPGRSLTKWEPLERAFSEAGYCTHIVRPNWDEDLPVVMEKF